MKTKKIEKGVSEQGRGSSDDGDNEGEGQRRKMRGRALSNRRTDDRPRPSVESRCRSRSISPTTSSTDQLDDMSDESSEPDLDSSDMWFPSGSSRDSSPDATEEGDRTSSRFSTLTPVGSAKKQGRKRGRASSRDHGQDSGWRPADCLSNQIPFTATPGPRGAAAQLDSDLPADFLELFLTDELLQHIVDQTNLYARQYFQAQPDSLPCSRGNAWKPVSVQELKTFLGLSFLTGYIKKPSLELYWSVEEVEATPFFNQTMARNRYQVIWKFLHYNDNASQDATDKLYKVRPVLDYIVGKFKELFQPGQNICIDEGMMKWRGHLSFKVYNPQKPVKYGIKSYILCDSATGYCFNMQPYVGIDRTLPEIVFSLLDRLPGHGYTLYMNNFYNSADLCERLLEAQTNVFGTLRGNVWGPTIITEKTKTGQRRHKNKFMPECVAAYNSSMNGVDKLDQNIAYYPFVRRSHNWSKKFVAYLFQLCIFNAYVIYRARNPGECKTLLDFMRRVVKSWTSNRQELAPIENEEELLDVGANGGGRPRPRAPYKKDPESRLDGDLNRHKLQYLAPTSKRTRPARKCRVCVRRGMRRETKMWCKSCCVPLHPGNCFTVYHTKINYSVED